MKLIFHIFDMNTGKPYEKVFKFKNRPTKVGVVSAKLELTINSVAFYPAIEECVIYARKEMKNGKR